MHRIEQSRFFARRIAEYLHTTTAPSTMQDVPVSRMEKPSVEPNTSQRFLLLMVLGLITLALKVRIPPAFRAAAIAAFAIWLLAVVVAERVPSSPEPIRTLEPKANSRVGH